MKILMLVEKMQGAITNPFVHELMRMLEECGHDVEAGVEKFWDDSKKFDIIHFHWPQILFNWRTNTLTEEDVKRVRERLNILHRNGTKIAYTRHNSVPHATKNVFAKELNRLVETSSDLIIHMGQKSLSEVSYLKNSSSINNVIIPHHIFESEPRGISKIEARKKLGINTDAPTVLCFGEFRSPEERLLLANACKDCGVFGLQVLSPLIFVHGGKPEDVTQEEKEVDALVKKILTPFMPKQRVGRVLDSDLPYYFAAADVVFIQRTNILNSGNLVQGFYYGCTVVGANVGNIGEILEETQNPTFNPLQKGSAAKALSKGFKYALEGKGEQNYKYAARKWNLKKTTSRLIQAYAETVGKEMVSTSIIMPSLNTAKYIKEALDSLTTQTLQNIEILCVDAGSTDGTREIIQAYAAHDSRIKLITSDVKSYGHQMNLGLDAAKGEFIGILEPDDYLAQDMCARFYQMAQYENLDFVKGTCMRFTTNAKGEKELTPGDVLCNENYYDVVLNSLDAPDIFINQTLGTPFALYRKTFLDVNNIRYNPSPGASYQDTGFFMQTTFYAKRCKFVKFPCYFYRQDNEASSRNDKGKMFVLRDEYDFVINVLNASTDEERKKKLLPYIYAREFSGHLFTLRRIGFENGRELEDYMRAKFSSLHASGIIHKELFSDYEWQRLVNYLKFYMPKECTCKISIIIPCYNIEKHIDECFNSILNQSLKELECICVDDGSTDDTLNILNKYAKKDSRVKVLTQENKGVYEARNRALAQARGEFVAFMDPDDLYARHDVLDKLYKSAKQNGTLIAGGSIESFLPDGEVIKIAENKLKLLFDKEEVVEFKDYQFALGYTKFIFSRLLLVHNGILFPPYLRFQDPPFMAAAMIAAKRFSTIPNIIYRYRIAHKKVDWTSNNCIRMKHLLLALEDLAKQAIEANLPVLLKTVEDEWAYYSKVVKNNPILQEKCDEEFQCLNQTLTQFYEQQKEASLSVKINPSNAISGEDAHSVIEQPTIRLLVKMLLPLFITKKRVTNRFNLKDPNTINSKSPVKRGMYYLLPTLFFMINSQHRATDNRKFKYWLPYQAMCDHLFRRYGLSSWNNVDLDGVSTRRPIRARGLRAFLPFGVILWLDQSQK